MKRKIIAVTACATGVAHTYMAAQALKKGAIKMGNLIKVETQGATGVENELSEKDVNIAEVVIFAVDTKVRNKERFEGKIILEVPVNAPIKNAEKVINDALQLIAEKVKRGL
jgi:PTS system fructose-specific IIB component